MRLSTRLLLLILGCLVPILAVQIWSLLHMQDSRRELAADTALKQAVAVRAELLGFIADLRRFGAAAAQVADASSAGCPDRLATMRMALPALRFLAVADESGRLLCGGVPGGVPGQLGWFPDAIRAAENGPGPRVELPGTGERLLSAVARLPTQTGDPPRLAVLGIDLAALRRQAETAFAQTEPSGGTLAVLDGAGQVIAHIPARTTGSSDLPPGGSSSDGLSEAVKAALARTGTGTEVVTGPDGQVEIIAHASGTGGAGAISVVRTVKAPGAFANLDRTVLIDLLAVALVAALAMVVAWLAGRRFISKPTEDLMRAVRRWQDGDLGARAPVIEAGSEFSSLAQSFNAMAAGLQAREAERQQQAAYLEAQVVERTRALSDTNNRLQVEIASRERTEAALHQAHKLQAVGQLAGGIAHDFNNMLATILGNLELMERRITQGVQHWTAADTEKMSRLIERAMGAVQRGSQLTSRLLAFSRRQPLSARATDINALISELVTLAGSTLGRRVRVSAELAADPAEALVDPSQLEASILNLCLNARDAMPDGGQLTITTSNTVVAERYQPDDPPPGHYVQITVADTGAGMTQDVRRRAFDPFFTTKGPGGSGLGLSQVYGMARQSGGTVWLESAPGKGTAVTLLLPRVIVETGRNGESNGSLSARAERKPCTVLVVDDDTEVRQVTVEMLGVLGCKVIEAASGPDALSILSTLHEPPHLALLDYAMPGMTGLELARQMRDGGLAMPIGLVTGFAELAEADTRAGLLDGLLRKPFTLSELQGLLARLRAVATDRRVLQTSS